MAEESELVGGISVSLGATHEHLAGDIAAANTIVEEQWSNKVFTAKLRVESASGAGQTAPATAPGAAQAGPVVVQARAVEEAGAQTVQARSALAIPTQQTTPGMTEGEKLVEGLAGVEDATGSVAKSVQKLVELQGKGTEAPTPAVVAQQRVERVQAAAGEIQPAAGSDVEAARTDALLASQLESLSANIVGLGDRPGGVSGLPATTPSMQMRDVEEEQAAAARSRRATQHEAVVAATAAQDRGIPDTSQEFLEERYTRPLAAQAAVESVVPAPRPATAAGPGPAASAPHSYNVSARGAYNAPGYNYDISSAGAQGPVHVASSSETFRTQDEAVAAGDIYAQRMAEKVREDLGMVPRREEATQAAAVERAAVAREPQRIVRQAVDTVEIAAQGVSMPAAQVEAQAASIEAPRAAVTTERPESVATTSVQPIVAGGGGRPPRRPIAVATPPSGERPEEGEPEGPTQYPRIQYVDRIERQRRQSRESRGMPPIEVNRSEQALSRQRLREEAIAAKQEAEPVIPPMRLDPRSRVVPIQLSRRQRVVVSPQQRQVERESQIALVAQDKLESQERLRNLTYEADRDAGEVPSSTSFAPHFTPAQVAARREEAARLDAAPAPPPTLAQRRQLSRQQVVDDERQRQAGIAAGAGPTIDTGARAEQARIANVEALKASARVRVQAFDEAAQERVVQSRRAAVTASGRTGRTAAFGIGTLFGGTQGRQIEAQAEASQAARQLRSAERAIQPLDDRLRDVAKAWQSSTGEARKFQREQFLGIRTSSQYKEALVGVRNALEADAAAQAKLTGLQGFRSITQNLLAGAAGGAAFGVALGAMSAGLSVAQKTLGAFIDEQTGFGSTSTRTTTALAAQTTALQGNIDAALSAAEAQAGLNQGAIEYLGTQLRLTTQIKAGSTAQQNASELFRAAAGAQNAPQGLFGGFGGVAGTGLLAEQMGGGKGFSEVVQGDLSNLSRSQDQGDIFAKIGQGLSYLTNPDFRQTIDSLSAQQGKPTPSQANPIGNALGGLLPIGGAAALLGGLGDQFFRGGQAPPTQQEVEAERAVQAQDVNGPIRNYLDNLNANIERGGGQGKFEFTADPEMRRLGMASAAAAGDLNGVTSASQGFIVTLNGAVASTKDYTAAISAAAVGASRPTQEALLGQFAQINPAIINAANRQQQFAANVQLPAQQALQNLATPLKPVGTGFAAANAEEQARVADTQKESQRLQDQLNARYEQGRQIIEDTYRASVVKNFGEAAGQQFDSLLTKIETTGQAIADIQSSISNEQAAYQTAQYNFQLGIAKRTLSDIGGLTGKNFGAGQSYLGQLEKENLALSRQGQQLQFNLSQRSINFQRAVAGFTAPGLTPEERAARIEQANIEADIAQKQLDIGKNIFQNQVQIVDIQNLRQGADLVKQIALLEQGRAVTIDVQVKGEELERLIAIQQQQVTEAGTYIAAVESLVQTAFGQIHQLEAVAGKAVAGIANKVLEQFGLTLNGINRELEEFIERLTPRGGGGFSSIEPRRPAGTSPGADRSLRGAAGLVGRTQGKTSITVGEAAGEEVAVLSNPRAYLGGGGGGSSVSVVFTGEITVRSEDDLRKMEQTVESAIIRALGRGSSLQGLRLS